MDLTGKWKYQEDYTYGKANGELVLRQEGDNLSGKIIFSDAIEGLEPFMLQEMVSGYVDGDRVKLEAVDYDIIYSETEVLYELDCWFGRLTGEDEISGMSKDVQGIVGHFSFVRMKENNNEK